MVLKYQNYLNKASKSTYLTRSSWIDPRIRQRSLQACLGYDADGGSFPDYCYPNLVNLPTPITIALGSSANYPISISNNGDGDGVVSISPSSAIFSYT